MPYRKWKAAFVAVFAGWKLRTLLKREPLRQLRLEVRDLMRFTHTFREDTSDLLQHAKSEIPKRKVAFMASLAKISAARHWLRALARERRELIMKKEVERNRLQQQ